MQFLKSPGLSCIQLTGGSKLCCLSGLYAPNWVCSACDGVCLFVSVCVCVCPPWKWQSGCFVFFAMCRRPKNSGRKSDAQQAVSENSGCANTANAFLYLHYSSPSVHLRINHTSADTRAWCGIPSPKTNHVSIATLCSSACLFCGRVTHPSTQTDHTMSHGLARDGWRLWTTAVCCLRFRCLPLRILCGAGGLAVMSIQWQMVQTKPVRIVRLGKIIDTIYQPTFRPQCERKTVCWVKAVKVMLHWSLSAWFFWALLNTPLKLSEKGGQRLSAHRVQSTRLRERFFLTEVRFKRIHTCQSNRKSPFSPSLPLVTRMPRRRNEWHWELKPPR